MPTRKKQSYTLEFKQSSAKLAAESDKSISQTAKDLGINETTLYSWVTKFNPERQTPPVVKESLDEENRRLRRENARLKQERDILKKATAFFANEDQ